MAEIRVNATGGLKLYDADDSHYAQIVAGTITSNVDAITLGHNLATFNAAVTAGGILKTDDTTEATSTTDGSLQTDGGLSVAKDTVMGDDLKLLSDASVIHFGANSEITLTHSHDSGLLLKHTATADDKPINLVLQTGETDLAQDDVIGKISFQAPDEGTGTDAILVSAAIQARAEGDHSSSSNATSLDFLTGASEAAAKKLSITSAGHFVPGADNTYDIGTASLEFKDGYFDGTLHCDVIDLAGTEYTAIASTMNALTDVSMDITNFVDGLLIQTDTDGSAPGTGTLSSATGNIGIGKDVFAALTDGTYNTAIGYQAADALTGGDDNIIIGKDAGGATTTGNDNVYIGLDAGKTLTSASQNIAIGSYAMDGATDLVCPNNVAIGYSAMSGALNNGATNNVCVGNGALKVLTDAKYSVGVGHDAGKAITTGFGNTCIGYNNGVQSTTGDYNTYLGYGAGATAADTTRAIAIGQDVRADSNDFSFGKTSNVVTNDFDADANWSRSSDVRLKKNITDQNLGLDFINDLRTVKYNWKPSTELDEKDAGLNHLRVDKDSKPVDHKDFDGTVVNNMNTTATMHNFIAQEVKAALDKEGVSDFGGWKEDQYGVQQVSREMFIIPLVKAVQELSAKVDTLETENTALKARVKTLEDA